MARRASKKPAREKVNFANVGKMFKENMEYPCEVKSAEVETGTDFPYVHVQLKGLDEGYGGATLHENFSTSPGALWKMREIMEAAGLDIPEGDLDTDELAAEFAEDILGAQLLVATRKREKPDGGFSIVPDGYAPMTDAKPAGKKATSKKKSAPEVDLDELDDDDIKALAEEFDIKGRSVSKLREALAAADPEDIIEACKDLGIGEEEKEEKRPFRSSTKTSRSEKDEDEDEGKPAGRSERGSKKSNASRKKKPSLTEDEVNEMNEEELGDLIEQHDLDVDLDDHKTLRKKKVAVIDALQEAGLIEE